MSHSSSLYQNSPFPMSGKIGIWIALGLVACNSVAAQDTAAQLEKVTSRLTNEKFKLEYKFKPGEQVFYEVVHQSAVKTKVEASSEKVRSRSTSLKKWDVGQVDAEGNLKFAYTIDYVNMWSEQTGRKPLRYDSRKDQEVPPEYAQIKKTLGRPISVVTASKHGKIISREDTFKKQLDRGTGGFIDALPDGPIELGGEWSVPATVSVQNKEGLYLQIKTRQRYRLESVAAGVATISVKTQVLTPVTEAKVKSQLVQKLSTGEIKFDIDAGRMISKELEWDETVIGFNGAQSNMSFLARMVERLVPAAEVASLRTPSQTR